MPPSRLEPLPRFLEPMLATSGGVPEGPGWAAEIKWDGCAGSYATTVAARRSGPGTATT